MKRLFHASALFALALGCLAASGAATAQKKSAPKVKLMETGEFHGEEIDARTGERWLGLYAQGGASYLAFSEVRVETVRDYIVDQEPDAKTGKRVSVGDAISPVFLVRGANELRPGAVTTVHVGEEPFRNATKIGLELAGTRYSLTVSTKPGKAGEVVSHDDAALIFQSGEIAQTLYALGGEGRETEVNWTLLWAGDADADGKLDLYLEVSSHYNASQRKLFLSSKAAKGRLLREVAEFNTTGC